MDADAVSSGEESRLAQAILQYLLQHPDAKDTREGIATWWVRRQEIQETAHKVSRALEFLVARDLITACRGPDQRLYYGLSQKQRDAIASSVSGTEPRW
jgi:hypothetical protein